MPSNGYVPASSSISAVCSLKWLLKPATVPTKPGNLGGGNGGDGGDGVAHGGDGGDGGNGGNGGDGGNAGGAGQCTRTPGQCTSCRLPKGVDGGLGEAR